MRTAAMFFVMVMLALVVGGASSVGNAALTRESRLETRSVSDNFERSELGSAWNVDLGTPGIVSGSDLGLLLGSFAILSWAAPLPADQFSEVELAAGIDLAMQRGVFVRRRASDLARYSFHYNLSVSPQRWELKYDGVPTPQAKLLATATAPAGPVAGDVIRIEVEGMVLRGYKNGQLILKAIDASAKRIEAGAPGAAFYSMGGSVTQPSPVFARWAGGALPEPRMVTFSRSGPVVLSATARPACFSVRFVANTPFLYGFTVVDVRNRVVSREIRRGEAGAPRIIRWCGRTTAKTPSQGKLLPGGKYRARLDVAVARAGEGPSSIFFTRTWKLTIRSKTGQQ